MLTSFFNYNQQCGFVKVEDSANRIGAGDREFLIHPTFGATVKTALNPNLAADSMSRAQGKKPFDWMHDEQFANLQVDRYKKPSLIMR